MTYRICSLSSIAIVWSRNFGSFISFVICYPIFFFFFVLFILIFAVSLSLSCHLLISLRLFRNNVDDPCRIILLSDSIDRIFFPWIGISKQNVYLTVFNVIWMHMTYLHGNFRNIEKLKNIYQRWEKAL